MGYEAEGQEGGGFGMNALCGILFVIVVVLALPPLVYLCSKLATAGYYRGRHLYEKWSRDREADD